MKELSYARIYKSQEYLASLGTIHYRSLFGGYSLTVGDTVCQTIVTPLMVLLENSIKITTVSVGSPFNHPRQITKTPVWPDKTNSSPRDGTADQRIYHAR